jgi:flagellar protein FlaF
VTPVGFSVSGASAIIFVGMFLSFGMVYTAASNGYEAVSEAQSAVHEDALAQKNTAIDVANVSYDAANDTLTVNVSNTGSSSLSVDRTDLVVDNEYQTTAASTTVEDDDETDLWLPGETLSFTLTLTASPTRVKVVTETGVAAMEVV